MYWNEKEFGTILLCVKYILRSGRMDNIPRTHSLILLTLLYSQVGVNIFFLCFTISCQISAPQKKHSSYLTFILLRDKIVFEIKFATVYCNCLSCSFGNTLYSLHTLCQLSIYCLSALNLLFTTCFTIMDRCHMYIQ